MPLRPLPAHVDLPALEHEVLERWARTDVFGRTVSARPGDSGSPR